MDGLNSLHVFTMTRDVVLQMSNRCVLCADVGETKGKGNVSFETEAINWVFPILNWKTHIIQLIRQQKIKIKKTSVRFEYPVYWSSSSHRKMLTVSKRQTKAFNSLQSCLTSSSSIQLIHLIKRILYKIEKTIEKKR